MGIWSIMIFLSSCDSNEYEIIVINKTPRYNKNEKEIIYYYNSSSDYLLVREKLGFIFDSEVKKIHIKNKNKINTLSNKILKLLKQKNYFSKEENVNEYVLYLSNKNKTKRFHIISTNYPKIINSLVRCLEYYNKNSKYIPLKLKKKYDVTISEVKIKGLSYEFNKTAQFVFWHDLNFTKKNKIVKNFNGYSLTLKYPSFYNGYKIKDVKTSDFKNFYFKDDNGYRMFKLKKQLIVDTLNFTIKLK